MTWLSSRDVNGSSPRQNHFFFYPDPDPFLWDESVIRSRSNKGLLCWIGNQVKNFRSHDFWIRVKKWGSYECIPISINLLGHVWQSNSQGLLIDLLYNHRKSTFGNYKLIPRILASPISHKIGNPFKDLCNDTDFSQLYTSIHTHIDVKSLAVSIFSEEALSVVNKKSSNLWIPHLLPNVLLELTSGALELAIWSKLYGQIIAPWWVGIDMDLGFHASW